jgi:hypothetical protein
MQWEVPVDWLTISMNVLTGILLVILLLILFKPPWFGDPRA